MSTSNKLNIAVVGLGWVATNRHIPIILRDPRLRFYGVVDKRAERIQNITVKYPWLKSSLSDMGDMPWGNEVHAVLIATDPLTHYRLAKKILAEGKHILMEKPLTMLPQEGRELQEIAASNNVTCCVVHNFQFARATLQLKDMMRNGSLGELLGIEAVQLSNPRRRLPVWYEQLPYGLFYDESPHMFYMLEALAGREINHITSTVLRKTGCNTPLSVTAYYTAGGTPIRVGMNFNASLSEWHIAVMGSKAIGIVDVFRDILVTMPNDGQHRAREILASSGSFMATHLRGFLLSGIRLVRGNLFYGSDVVWEKFVNGLEMKQPPPEISAASGLRIVERQHEIMGKSALFELPADENPDH
jgi:predicted dehydrogenase